MKQAKLDFSKAKPKSPAPPAEVTPKKAAKVDQPIGELADEYEDEEEDEGDERTLTKSGNKMLDKFHDMSVKERRRAVRIFHG